MDLDLFSACHLSVLSVESVDHSSSQVVAD